jgi:hypothetical protein
MGAHQRFSRCVARMCDAAFWQRGMNGSKRSRLVVDVEAVMNERFPCLSWHQGQFDSAVGVCTSGLLRLSEVFRVSPELRGNGFESDIHHVWCMHMAAAIRKYK